ncbi:MAG: hypothetical protein ACRBCK_08115 [Alphaproteobacteria bacterium]
MDDTTQINEPEIVITAPAPAREKLVLDERLVLKVNKAHYDEDKQLANVKMGGALQKAFAIGSYDGEHITLTYNGVKIDLDECPEVNVSPEDVKYSLGLWNSITLKISNLPPEQAIKIEDAQCLNIDTSIVKQVIRGIDHDTPEP